jgi:nucleoside-diphosphate-sugar epimerase
VKTALVTGSAGFVGRHMGRELAARGYSVVECDPAGPARNDALDVFRLSTQCYDLVVHCAAQAPHRAAIDGQPATHVYNQLLDAAMFDWAIRTGQRRVLYFSSCAVLDGPDDYGALKLTGERMARQARAAGVPVTVVRPFSGYGEDQGTDWPFGAFLDRASRRDDPFTVWGDGGQVRDWIHVDDVVSGALAVVESGTEDPVSLCTGVGTSMLDLAQLACREAGYEPNFELRMDKPAGVAHRVGDPARLHRYYTPTVSIEEGVKRALAAR